MIRDFKMFSKQNVCVLEEFAVRKREEKTSSIKRVGERRSKQVS